MTGDKIKQGLLFAERRFRRICRDDLLLAGLYSPAPVIIEAIFGLTRSDKAVYWAALHHLRGAATSVSVGLDRLAAMTAMSRRSAGAGVTRLQAVVLIDAWRRRQGGLWCIAFAPLDWWLREQSRKVDPGLIERLLNIYAGESAIIRFVEAAAAPSEAAAPIETAAPDQEKISRPQAEFAPPQANFSTIQEKFAPKALTRTDLTSAARAALRSISSNSQNDTTDSEPAYRTGRQDCRGHFQPGPASEIAEEWEELLGLSGKARTPEQEDEDFQSLLDVAADLLKGNLGPAESAKNHLGTLAHQIGRRPVPARTPLGLFLSDGVGKLRIRAMRL